VGLSREAVLWDPAKVDWNPEAFPSPPQKSNPVLSLEAEGRLSFSVGGDVVPTQSQIVSFFGIPVVQETKGTSYRDLYPMGWGFALEAGLTWELGPDHRVIPIKEVGPYLSAGFDSFRGKTASDQFGDSFSPGPLQETTILVGVFVGDHPKEGFFGEVRVGIGMVHYASVKATFSIPGTPSTSGELLAETFGVASELGAKIGFCTGKWDVSIGVDLRIHQGPDRGKDVSNAVKPDPPVFFGIDLGIAYRF
jgi:hypothetical protein